MESNFSLTNPIIQRDPPNAVVYDLSEPDQVTIILPARSTWTSGLHWHENHVEYLRVINGSVQITLGDQVRVVSAADGEIRVDRNVWHEWRRADLEGGGDVVVVERTDPADGDKAVFFWNLNGVIILHTQQQQQQQDGQHQHHQQHHQQQQQQGLACPPYLPRRLHGILLDFWVTLTLFSIFYHLDNIPVFANVPQAFAARGFTFTDGTLGHTLLQSIDRFISHLIIFVASRVAWLLGIVPVHDSFTPKEVYQRWIERRGAAKKTKIA